MPVAAGRTDLMDEPAVEFNKGIRLPYFDGAAKYVNLRRDVSPKLFRESIYQDVCKRKNAASRRL
jgi:hypothetical protein